MVEIAMLRVSFSRWSDHSLLRRIAAGGGTLLPLAISFPAALTLAFCMSLINTFHLPFGIPHCILRGHLAGGAGRHGVRDDERLSHTTSAAAVGLPGQPRGMRVPGDVRVEIVLEARGVYRVEGEFTSSDWL